MNNSFCYKIILLAMTIISISTIIVIFNKANLKTISNINKIEVLMNGKEIGIVEKESVVKNALYLVKDAYNTQDTEEYFERKYSIVYNKKISTKEKFVNEIELANKIINNINEIENEKTALEKLSVSERANRGEENNITKETFFNNTMNTPVNGVLTSNFGEKRSGSIHKGIDVAAPTGTPIEAALSGTVYYSGVAKGYGKVVIINHDNDLQTIYAHCNELNVSTGEKVEQGQIIAKVGNTGDSTGPHLHFELKMNGTAIDPFQYNGKYEH